MQPAAMDVQVTLTDGTDSNTHTPLCEFGETVRHMLPAVKEFPKLEPRFYNGIDQQPIQKGTAEPTSPMATSPTHQKRPAASTTAYITEEREGERVDTIAEGSTSKQQRTTTRRQSLERPTPAEQPQGKMIITAALPAIFPQEKASKWRQHPLRTEKQQTMKGSYPSQSYMKQKGWIHNR